MKVIAVYSAKGGVGKSTIAVHLAHLSASRSARRTLLWDLDAQGAATFAFRLTAKPGPTARGLFAREVTVAERALATDTPNLDLLAADTSLRRLDGHLEALGKRNRLRNLLADLGDRYDRVILDAPPSQADLADQIYRAANLLVIPLLPTPLSLRVYEQMVDHIARAHGGKVKLLPLFSMADRRKSLHREIVASQPTWPVIPYASEIERLSIRREPPAAVSSAARAFGELWQRIEATV